MQFFCKTFSCFIFLPNTFGLFNTDQYDHLIIINGFYGLTQSNAQHAIEILNQ